MLTMGIDSGSAMTKAVLFDGQEIVDFRMEPSGSTPGRVIHRLYEELRTPDTAFVVATGYGRALLPEADKSITEITCHGAGAAFLCPGCDTVIDIGGQDSKVINLDEAGHVSGFMMNDKCAAGTGRFLEMMARTLELDMEEMSRRGLTWEKELTISSMCTVFAESEVISLIADNHTDSDIIHGLNQSIAGKTAAMAARAKGQPPYMMTGGVARNRGVVQALEEKLGAKLLISENPDLCGALGAALFALHGD